MKKLLVLLLISIMAIFVFAGCDGIGTPAEGEGVEEVTVEVDGQYEEAGKIYVPGDNNDITVTFPEPVSGMVTANVSDCSGDYSKAAEVALFPNEDRTVWEGSASFSCETVTSGPCVTDTCEIQDCCASIVTVQAGECGEDGVCVEFPVIVDCDAPYLFWIRLKC